MLKMLFGNGLWQLVLQADMISKVVLIILLIMSILCWTIFFYKLILLRLKKRHMCTVSRLIKQAKSLEEMSAIASGYAGTIPGYFLTQNLLFLKDLLEKRQEANFDRMSEYMDAVIEDIVYRQESYLPVLSTCANISPLLGLFGTVWGLIQAFIGISQQQSADIASIAPGIAEALITTFFGLVVAIPALVMFSYLSVQINRLESQLLNLSDAYRCLVERFLT
ncbi:MotA/TolQ/ExbB proton channel family protein [Candidatus Dependentiae bacterium]|nr:MotA/TolQ/ExbB proton channel family protein [Candidatus Dependentiae bacterium]